MKKLASLGAFLLLAVCSGSASVANENRSGNQKALWYFPPGFTSATNPAEQMKIYLRFMNSEWTCFQGNPHGMDLLIPGNDSYRKEVDLASTSSITNPHAKMTIVLDHYVEIKNGPDKGKFLVTTLCGQKIVSAEEVKAVVDDLVERVKIAKKIDNDYYQPILADAVKIGAEKRGLPQKIREHLDSVIPGEEKDKITYREYYYLPEESRGSDFVPRELHLGYNLQLPGIFGVTWLNTGMVYYNPMARMLDYLIGKPAVLEHEMIHGNSNLQSWPLADAFNVELMASIPMMLHDENQIDFFFHGYAKTLRMISQVYFGYDFDEVRKKIIKFDDGTGNWIIDEAAWNKYFNELEQIKSELRENFLPHAIAEFYSDEGWWLAMNHRLNDDDAVFRLMMAKHYETTGLGGLQATKRWEEANKEKIIRIADDAWRKMGDDDSGSGEMQMDQGAIPGYLVQLYKEIFTEKQRQAIEAYYRKHPEELKKLLSNPNPAKLLEAMRSLMAKWQEGGVR